VDHLLIKARKHGSRNDTKIVVLSCFASKFSFIGFGFASCCEAWLCLAVSARFQLGYALNLLQENTSRAKPKTNYRSHTAGPCLTTAGKAESNETGLWDVKQSLNQRL